VNRLSNPLPPSPSHAPVPEPHPSFFQRRVVTPLLDLLRVGCSPRKLAWSLAVGFVIGINPLLGSTTIVCFVIAYALRLNLIASQIANHIVYPCQVLLFLFFIRVGDLLFHTGKLPLEGHALFHAARVHPWTTTRILWTWEWHALIAWAVMAAIAAPILAAILTPFLTRMHTRLHHEQVAA
jgi:uncharacterized protein (DUF2062 family)